MYLLDESYFVKDIVLPPSGNQPDITGGMNITEQYIDTETRLILQQALGDVYFTDFDSNVTVEGVFDKDNAPQKWVDFVNGKSYTYDGIKYKWKGLLFAEFGINISLLAYYVYAKYANDNRSHLSGIGEVSGKAINSANVYSTRRYVKNYNRFVDMYCGDTKANYVSLLTYLDHQGEDFEEAAKEKAQYENVMGF